MSEYVDNILHNVISMYYFASVIEDADLKFVRNSIKFSFIILSALKEAINQ